MREIPIMLRLTRLQAVRLSMLLESQLSVGYEDSPGTRPTQSLIAVQRKVDNALLIRKLADEAIPKPKRGKHA